MGHIIVVEKNCIGSIHSFLLMIDLVKLPLLYAAAVVNTVLAICLSSYNIKLLEQIIMRRLHFDSDKSDLASTEVSTSHLRNETETADSSGEKPLSLPSDTASTTSQDTKAKKQIRIQEPFVAVRERVSY